MVAVVVVIAVKNDAGSATLALKKGKLEVAFKADGVLPQVVPAPQDCFRNPESAPVPVA